LTVLCKNVFADVNAFEFFCGGDIKLSNIFL